VRIPLLHIADPTAQAIRATGHTKVGLLGTRFTMEQDFYKTRLIERHGLEVQVPPPAARETLHRIIYDELCRGVIREESRREYQAIAAGLIEAGAQCVILGCTEIGLLLKDGDVPAPLFDTTALHARAAALAALE
jgi:aspartate racemase